MSSPNRRGKAATLPSKRGNSGDSSSPQRESSKTPSQNIAESNVAHDLTTSSNPGSHNPNTAASSSARPATTLLASAPEVAGRPIADAHGEVVAPFGNSEETTAGRESFLPGSLSTAPPETSVDNSSAVGSRKRFQSPVGGTPKRSKLSIAEPDEPGEIGDVEDDAAEEENEEEESEEVNEGMNEEEKKEANKKAKEEGEQLDKLVPYRSIKTIKVPKRSNADKLKPSERQPQKGDKTTWYGTMTYEDSMLTFFCDEERLSYTKTSKEEAFKNLSSKPICNEWVRRRHVAALLQQAQTYGAKDEQDIPTPTAAEARRGKKRGPGKGKEKASSSTDAKGKGAASNTPAETDTAQGSTQPRFVREAPIRRLEMTAIVVFKDLYAMSFEKIQDILEKDHNWKVDLEQIEQYYNYARPAAYGSKPSGHRGNEGVTDQEQTLENKSAEAAAGILVGLAQGRAGGGVGEKQAVEVSQTNNNNHGDQVVFGTGVGNGLDTNATQSHSVREIEAGNALLQLRAQPVVKAPEANVEAAESETTIDMDIDYDNEDLYIQDLPVTRGPPA
jgi:hypothetical protein